MPYVYYVPTRLRINDINTNKQVPSTSCPWGSFQRPPLLSPVAEGCRAIFTSFARRGPLGGNQLGDRVTMTQTPAFLVCATRAGTSSALSKLPTEVPLPAERGRAAPGSSRAGGIRRSQGSEVFGFIIKVCLNFTFSFTDACVCFNKKIMLKIIYSKRNRGSWKGCPASLCGPWTDKPSKGPGVALRLFPGLICLDLPGGLPGSPWICLDLTGSPWIRSGSAVLRL